MAVLMAVLKNIFNFAENRTGPASNWRPTLSTGSQIPLSRHYFFWAVEQIPKATPKGVRSGPSQQISVMGRLPSSIGCLPSLEAGSLNWRHFTGFAEGDFDDNLGWGLIFEGLSASDFVVARDFLIDRKSF